MPAQIAPPMPAATVARSMPARPADVLGHEQRTHGADPELARAADVEEPAAEREGDREARQHERREQHQRRDEVVLGQERLDAERIAGDQVERPVEAGADDEILVDAERVGAREGHREAAHEQGEEDRQQREPELARATATREMRLITRAPCRRSWRRRARARPSDPLARSSTICPRT